MYESLTRYVDLLKPARKQIVERGGKNYCFLEYNEMVRMYSRDVHALITNDEPDYREYINGHNISMTDNLKYINVNSLSAQTILFLLLFIETAERKNAGFRSEFIRNGFINDALKRLRELDS